jgi:hypothetical protein
MRTSQKCFENSCWAINKQPANGRAQEGLVSDGCQV